MRLIVLIVMTFALASVDAADLEAARAYQQQGEEALIAANTDTSKCVDAALLLTKARAIYEEAEQWDKVQELNSYIFWCKKRMNNSDLDRYLAGKASGTIPAAEARALMQTVEQVAETKVSANEAEQYLARADQFAADNPDKLFQIHLRYLEVAERFERLNTEVAVKSVRLSSAALEQYARTLNQTNAIPPNVFQSSERPQPGSLPVPDTQELVKAGRMIKRDYRDRFRAETPSELRSFMKWLFSQAKQSTDNSAACYALVDQAAEVAVDRKVRDLLFVIACADYIHTTFANVDPIALKREWLDRARGYPPAKAIADLLIDPANAEAASTAGKYLCFVAGNWTDGLPLLSRSEDPILARLAAMETVGPDGTAQQHELADAWYDMSSEDRTYEEGMLRRARHWYERCVDGLKGISQDQVRERITEITDELPLVWAEIDWNNLSEKTWDKLDGDVVTCNAKHMITDTGQKLADGQRVRIVPHPTDQWGFDVGGRMITCTGMGTSGTGGDGSLRCSLGRNNGSPTFNIKEVTGPGLIVLRPIFPSGTRAGKGSIRCKIVTYPPPE